jgi:hypothetical protein
LNKKLQKGIVAAVAATMGTGIVAPVYAASAETTDLAGKYAKAYEATANAKTQKELTEARKLVDALYAQVKGTPDEYLATTLSSLLDPVQQKELLKLDEAIKAAEAKATQVNVNAARALIVDMPEVWKNAFSSYIDTIQNEIITSAVEAIEAAVASGVQADLDAANALYNELLTVTNNDGVKSWVETALKAELDKVVVAPKVASSAAIGAKKLEVKFNQVVDTTKAAVTVKKGSVPVSTDKIEFSEDKTSVVITTTTSLTKGDYIISVAGLTATALTSTVTAEDVKVAKINITSPTAPVVSSIVKTKALVRYEVLNQYGEKMSNQTISWTISTGLPVTSEHNTTTSGDFLITAAGGQDFIPGSTVYITGVHAASGTVFNGEVKVALEAKADKVEFKGVYNTTTSKIESLPAGFTNGKYVLLIEVKDQYGNKLTPGSVADLVFTSNNPLFVSSDANNSAFTAASNVTIDNVTYTAVNLVQGTSVDKGGSVTVQAISTATGTISTYTMEAQAVAGVKTFTMGAPEKLVAEGEKVEIPFTAVDQYGNAVTKFSALTNGNPISLTAPSGSGLAFEQQNDGTAKLYFTAAANAGATDNNDAPIYLSSLVINGGSYSSQIVNVKETAKPVAVIGIDTEKATSIAKGNYVDIYGKDLIIQDQYGRTLTDTKVETWLDTITDSAIVITPEFASSGDKSPFTVILNQTVLQPGSDSASQVLASKTDYVRVSAKIASGLNSTEKVEIALSTTNTPAAIASSVKSITFTKVDQAAYASYEVADLGTMYNDTSVGTTQAPIDPATAVTAAGYNKTLKVYGVKADGTKVLLPASDYLVSTNGKLAVNANVISDATTAGYVGADFKDTANNYKDVKVNVLVTVNDANGAAAAVLEKELVISNKTPEVTAVAFDTDVVTDGKATVKGDAVTTAKLNAAIKTSEVKDQYGVVITEAPVITITNLVKVDGSELRVNSNGTSSANITSAKMGDKFRATYKYASGKTVVVDFTVGLDDTVPSFVSTSIDSTHKIVTLTFSENLADNTANALKAAITVDLDGNGTDEYVALGASDTVAITGKTIVVTFSSALTTTNANKLKVAASTVKDATGNVTSSVVTIADIDN